MNPRSGISRIFGVMFVVQMVLEPKSSAAVRTATMTRFTILSTCRTGDDGKLSFGNGKIDSLYNLLVLRSFPMNIFQFKHMNSFLMHKVIFTILLIFSKFTSTYHICYNARQQKEKGRRVKMISIMVVKKSPTTWPVTG